MSLDPLACGHDNVKQSKIVALTVSLGDKKLSILVGNQII